MVNYITYFRLFQKLSSYVTTAKKYGYAVKLDKLIIPAQRDKITEKLVGDMEQELQRTLKKIKAGQDKETAIQRLEDAVNFSYRGTLLGKMPEFKYFDNITDARKARQDEYRAIRRSYMNSRRYYKNKYGIEMDELPVLDKNMVPTESQLNTLRQNIDSQKKVVKQIPKKFPIMIDNIKRHINDAIDGQSGPYSEYKAKLVDKLFEPYINDPKGMGEKLEKAKERIDRAVERFIYDSDQTFEDSKTNGKGITRTEAWEVIVEAFPVNARAKLFLERGI